MKKSKPFPLVLLVIYSILIFITVNALIMYMFIYNYKTNVINETQLNIKEYEEVDLSHLCQMFECSYIKNNNILYKNVNLGKKYIKLVKSNEDIVRNFKLMDNLYLIDNFDILIEVSVVTKYNGYFVVSKTNLFKIIDNWYYKILVIIITLNLTLLMYNVINYRKFQLKKNIMSQHEGYYKSMMLITENIHHELNTPLSVVNNKINKLKGKLEEIYTGAVSKDFYDLEDSKKDFEITSAALTQIADLLNRMRPFKDVKHQNNRDLKTVIKTACDMMMVSQHERYDYEIFNGFGDYKLNGEYLKNGEFTAILLNFVKNSLDAHAYNIQFKIKDFKDGKLTFFIIDDGNGIPKESQSSIFKDNSSSKSKSRGSGLHTNKFLIDNADGNLKLAHSVEGGTIFELTVRAEKI